MIYPPEVFQDCCVYNWLGLCERLEMLRADLVRVGCVVEDPATGRCFHHVTGSDVQPLIEVLARIPVVYEVQDSAFMYDFFSSTELPDGREVARQLFADAMAFDWATSLRAGQSIPGLIFADVTDTWADVELAPAEPIPTPKGTPKFAEVRA